jgi:hypothetical protein
MDIILYKCYFIQAVKAVKDGPTEILPNYKDELGSQLLAIPLVLAFASAQRHLRLLQGNQLISIFLKIIFLFFSKAPCTRGSCAPLLTKCPRASDPATTHTVRTRASTNAATTNISNESCWLDPMMVSFSWPNF